MFSHFLSFLLQLFDSFFRRSDFVAVCFNLFRFPHQPHSSESIRCIPKKWKQEEVFVQYSHCPKLAVPSNVPYLPFASLAGPACVPPPPLRVFHYLSLEKSVKILHVRCRSCNIKGRLPSPRCRNVFSWLYRQRYLGT